VTSAVTGVVDAVSCQPVARRSEHNKKPTTREEERRESEKKNRLATTINIPTSIEDGETSNDAVRFGLLRPRCGGSTVLLQRLYGRRNPTTATASEVVCEGTAMLWVVFMLAPCLPCRHWSTVWASYRAVSIGPWLFVTHASHPSRSSFDSFRCCSRRRFPPFQREISLIHISSHCPTSSY